jgi:hypothetical protein
MNNNHSASRELDASASTTPRSKPTTDVNDFDAWLKQNLLLDVLFRCAIWAAIAACTAYLALFYAGIPPIDFLTRMTSTLAPLVNMIGTFSLLLCILALLLKDLESSMQDPIKVAAARGYLAGIIRRAAGDLSLWTLGAFVTMLTSLVVVWPEVVRTEQDSAAATKLSYLLGGMAIVTAFVNVFVRRAGPVIVGQADLPLFFRRTATITVIYGVCLGYLIVRLIWLRP